MFASDGPAVKRPGAHKRLSDRARAVSRYPVMIHALLVLALIVFLLWLLFHAFSALVHLLWIVIVVALVIWVVRMALGRSRT